MESTRNLGNRVCETIRKITKAAREILLTIAITEQVVRRHPHDLKSTGSGIGVHFHCGGL
jgi:hypothetical protein